MLENRMSKNEISRDSILEILKKSPTILTIKDVERKYTGKTDSSFYAAIADLERRNMLSLGEILKDYGKKYNIKNLPFGMKPNTRMFFHPENREEQIENWFRENYKFLNDIDLT